MRPLITPNVIKRLGIANISTILCINMGLPAKNFYRKSIFSACSRLAVIRLFNVTPCCKPQYSLNNCAMVGGECPGKVT